MSTAPAEQKGRTGRRVGGFIAGLVVGGSALGVAVVLVLTAGYIASRFSSPQTVGLVSVGADVGALGGVQVVVDQGDRLIHQDCRGACDDLRVARADSVRTARVLSASGACITCRRYLFPGVLRRLERPFRRERGHP